ncbi:MAG: hypothetical protein IJ869_03425 [Clostridiales bacterium]|nr:hypothetical protein [Clostridiales bacterium]HAW16483.1 hypothetical protein [Clostridiales bacterium]
MACFLVSATEAVVVKAAEKAIGKKESSEEGKISLTRKLHWLSNMLFGGSALLAFEHVWHGEVTPWFPFLTAMSTPVDMWDMIREMATVGVSMALLITAVWAGMCVVCDAIMKRSVSVAAEEN